MKKVTTQLIALVICTLMLAASCTKEKISMENQNFNTQAPQTNFRDTPYISERNIKLDTPYIPESNVKLDTPNISIGNAIKLDTPYVKN